jgi:transcriptional regulator with XRE-family HTH domain
VGQRRRPGLFGAPIVFVRLDGHRAFAVVIVVSYHRRMKAHVLTDPTPAPRRFRQFLQEELASRCVRNPRYSLRAFARYLRLDHSTLSQLLRGRRRFTARTVERIGTRLSLAPAVITQFVELERTPPESWAARELRQLSRDASLSVGAVSALAGRSRALTGSNSTRVAHYSATTIAVPDLTSQRIAERVEQFRREIGQMLDSVDAERDQVYRLELAFFPVADLPDGVVTDGTASGAVSDSRP